MERRFTSAKTAPLEARADGDKKKCGGYAAVFYNPADPNSEYVLWDYAGERAVERIVPGAFDKALLRPDDVRCLQNHNPDLLLGRNIAGTLRLSTDARGLIYECDLPNTTYANDFYESLRRKDCTGSSFAFTVDEERWTETKDATGNVQVVRELLSVALADVSGVTYPAYESASVGLRQSGEVNEARSALQKHRNSITLAAKIAGYRERAKLVS